MRKDLRLKTEDEDKCQEPLPAKLTRERLVANKAREITHCEDLMKAGALPRACWPILAQPLVEREIATHCQSPE